jgi:hypothetical protein
LLARNGARPALREQNGPRRIEKLATTTIDPAHTPERAKNQALPDLQACWLTRRFLISAPLATMLAPLVFPEART